MTNRQRRQDEGFLLGTIHAYRTVLVAVIAVLAWAAVPGVFDVRWVEGWSGISAAAAEEEEEEEEQEGEESWLTEDDDATEEVGEDDDTKRDPADDGDESDESE